MLNGPGFDDMSYPFITIFINRKAGILIGLLAIEISLLMGFIALVVTVQHAV